MKTYDKQIGGSHYQKYKIQPSKFVIENELLYPEGCAIKYIIRHRDKGKKQDLEKCKLCKGNSGWVLTEQGRSRLVDRYSPTMEEHINLFHPNNEVLDDVDMMVMFPEEKEQLRKDRINGGYRN